MVAGLILFHFADRAWYMYGMSGSLHREKMPNYMLQWEAMRWACSKGAEEYDLWGVPDEDEETLEAQFTERNDGLWGVYRFKEGLGGQVVRTLGAWDFAPSPLWYKMYSEVIPRVLDVMRSRGRAMTKQNLGE